MRIKDVRAVAQRRERERTGLFFAEGARAAAIALELGWEVEAIACGGRPVARPRDGCWPKRGRAGSR